MDRPWLRPLLWQVWRLGGIGPNEPPLIRFTRSHNVEQKDLEVVCKQDYLTLTGIRGGEVSYEVTDKGLDFVLKDETSLWKERLKDLVYVVEETSKVSLAKKLRSENIPYTVISTVIGKNAQVLLEDFEFKVKRTERVNLEIQKFLLGEVPFKELSIEVLFHKSPSISTALHQGFIHTLVKLLSNRSSDLIKKRGIGSMHVTRIKDRLELFGEYLES